MKRGSCLLEAYEVINGERQNVYGAPEDSFALIAEYWTVYLGIEVKAPDVALLMSLFKIAREANQYKHDNMVDIAGYVGIYDTMMHTDPLPVSCDPVSESFDTVLAEVGGVVDKCPADRTPGISRGDMLETPSFGEMR
jgi:hypothetical protein